MDNPAPKPAIAWQPLTPRGVVAFAPASFNRVFLVQLIFALFAASVVGWFFHHAWFPVISKSALELPPAAEIRAQRLSWSTNSPQVLGENTFLSISVDPTHEGHARSPAHLQIELGAANARISSLAGFIETPYPAGWRVGLNRAEAEPWWGAWSPAVLALIIAATIVYLFVSWWLLALLYFFPVSLIAFIANRALTLAGSLRISAAALMPGALFFSAGIFLYGLGAFDLLVLGLFTALHIIIGWIFLCLAIWRLPPNVEAAKARENPFASTGS